MTANDPSLGLTWNWTATDYTPSEWNEEQRSFHNPLTLEDAFHHASCLAGGWYRREVTIDMQIVGDDEIYRLRPSDAPVEAGWEPIYSVKAHSR